MRACTEAARWTQPLSEKELPRAHEVYKGGYTERMIDLAVDHQVHISQKGAPNRSRLPRTPSTKPLSSR
jgi:hypothetical protein